MPATILIIEDHLHLSVTLKRWLETKFPGCHVVEATHGKEAIALAQHTEPHVIIVDIGPLGADGPRLVELLKGFLPAIPIVALANYDSETSRTCVIGCGASAYIEKNTITAKLQPTVARLLSAAV
ncbi:MAG: response regulator [Anaerolineaceae bacterium]|nr:response regulator [Anaerolineaceae bacterium]MCB9099236.1 response regulator [Anaerolineales bacterium]